MPYIKQLEANNKPCKRKQQLKHKQGKSLILLKYYKT